MSREWLISLLAAVLCHVGLLYGFQAALVRPPRLVSMDAVEVTLVAAPAAAATVFEPPGPVPDFTPQPQPVAPMPPKPASLEKPPPPPPPPVIESEQPVVQI